MKPKGRHWLALWLTLFLAVAAVVVARDTASYRSARRLAELRQVRVRLEAEQAELIRRVRLASSREVLVPKVERTLGLHRPTDTEYVLFSHPEPAAP